MKIVCRTCSYESVAVRSLKLLPDLIKLDGGFNDSEGYFCPNGHHCKLEHTGCKGIRKLPGTAHMPGRDTIAGKLIQLIHLYEVISVEELTLKAWYEWPDIFGLPGHTMVSADSNKVQSLLSKPLKKLVTRPSPRVYRLTPEARELWDAQQRDTGTEQEHKAGGYHPARNGQPDIERPVRKGSIS